MYEWRKLARRLTFLMIYEADMRQEGVNEVMAYHFNENHLSDFLDASQFFKTKEAGEPYESAILKWLHYSKLERDKKPIDINLDDLKEACWLLEYVKETGCGTETHQQQIDVEIDEHAHKWRTERMPSVDKNILRMAIYEYRYGKRDIDKALVINEALDLAKCYSAEESYKFINGVLDAALINGEKS